MKMTSFVSYIEFKALLGETKRSSDPLWCRYFFRPLSFPIGWLVYKIGIKANHVSLISIFLALLSSLIMVFGSMNSMLPASLLMLLVALSDCIDGNIARARGETGPGGEWMDALSGYTVYALLPLALGIHVSLHRTDDLLPGLWIIVGAVTSISNLFLRLIYQKFFNSMLVAPSKENLKINRTLFSRFSSEMGLVGWMMPALLAASITNMLFIYLVFYCFFYVTSAVLVTIILILKVR